MTHLSARWLVCCMALLRGERSRLPSYGIDRYSLPEMAAIWSEERKPAVRKEVEVLVVEA